MTYCTEGWVGSIEIPKQPIEKEFLLFVFVWVFICEHHSANKKKFLFVFVLVFHKINGWHIDATPKQDILYRRGATHPFYADLLGAKGCATP